MADIEDAWSFVEVDEDDDDALPKRRPIEAPGVQQLLVEALLKSVLDLEALREIEERPAFCLVFQVPAADWALAVGRQLKAIGNWDTSVIRTTAPGRHRKDDAIESVANVLSAGGRVLGVTQTAALLPHNMLSAADRVVVAPALGAERLAEVIKQVTGDLPIDVPANLGVGLGFDELAGCIRPGSSSAECVDRLKRAAERKFGAGKDADVPLFQDLHGYGEAKQWGLDLLTDLEAWRRGDVPWSAMSASVILTSIPGLGKTSMLRSLAKSAGVPLVATSVAQWFLQGSGYLDDVIKQMDAAFAAARGCSPSILFLDEIDAVPNRQNVDSRHADYWAVVVGHLLTLLDGVLGSSTDNLILVGATNFAGQLDRALTRPGRFTRIIEIQPPDARALEGILRQHLGSDLTGEDLSRVAQLAVGATGAMVVEIIKTARRSARNAKRPMSMADLVDAVAPRDSRSREHVQRMAIHEAGHAVIAQEISLGEVLGVSVVQRGDVGGYVHIKHSGHTATRLEVEKVVIQALAGRAAEEVILGEPGTGAGGDEASDLARATHFVGTLHLSSGLGEHLIYRCSPEEVGTALARLPRVADAVEADLTRLYTQAVELVRAHVTTISAVAEALLERRHLAPDEFLAAMRTAAASTH